MIRNPTADSVLWRYVAIHILRSQHELAGQGQSEVVCCSLETKRRHSNPVYATRNRRRVDDLSAQLP